MVRFITQRILVGLLEGAYRPLIRRAARQGDRGELDAFFRSWCLYDWPGADLIADDGKRGHYTRPHTLSRGDPVCDMCWSGCPLDDAQGA